MTSYGVGNNIWQKNMERLASSVNVFVIKGFDKEQNFPLWRIISFIMAKTHRCRFRKGLVKKIVQMMSGSMFVGHTVHNF
jgi:hypothetical protein